MAQRTEINNLSRFSTSVIYVIASLGVVNFHIHKSMFYLGQTIPLHSIKLYTSERGILWLLIELFNGASAVIGLFLICSGYGLYKSYQLSDPYDFLLNRFKKVYLYAFIMAIICYLLYAFIEKKINFNCWSYFIPLFAFYDGFDRDRVTIQYWYLSLQFIYYIFFMFTVRVKSIENLFIFCLCNAFIFGFFLIVADYCGYKITSPYHSVFVRLPEFFFGIILAKSRFLELRIFIFSYPRLLLSMTLLIVGYFCFFGELSYIIAHFIYSVGMFYFISQISNIIIKINLLKRAVNYLSGGTFTLYCLHMSVIYYVYVYFTDVVNSSDFSDIVKYSVNECFLLTCCIILLIVGKKIESLYQSIILKIDH